MKNHSHPTVSIGDKTAPLRSAARSSGSSLTFLAACAVLAAPFAALAAVQGTVLDAATGAPIANAAVKYSSGSPATSTDAQGRFQLPTVTGLGPVGRSAHGRPFRTRSMALGTFLDGGLQAFGADGRMMGRYGRSSRPGFLPDPGPAGGVTGMLPSAPGASPAAARVSAAPCLLAVEAAGYKPREANCADGTETTVRIAAEAATRFYYQVPVEAGDGLVPGDLKDAVADPKPILDVMDSLAAKRYKEVHGLLILKGGKLVLEEYYKGNADTIDFEKGIKRIPLGNIHWGRTGKHYLASANKSITSIITGLALTKGNRTVTTPLSQLLPRYQAQFTGTKTGITVAHALTMTMGFQWDEWAGRDLIDMWATADIGAYAMAKPMAAAPGAQWIYNSAGPNLLLAAMETATGVGMAAFAKENLFAPLGIEDYRWGTQPNGLQEGSAKMFMRPRDMAKLGLVFLKGGVWQGRQVVPAAWVAESTRLHLSAKPKSPNDYGYLWWVRKLTTPKGAVVDYYQAEGDGGQYIVVLPAQDMVVVATGGNYGDFGTYEAQMGRILARHVLPALNL